MLLPLALLGLGLWEQQRGASDEEAMELQRGQAAKAVALLEARPAQPDGRPDFGARFRRNGHTYVGPLALSEARDALDDAESALALSRARRYLPPVVAACAGVAAGLSVLALLAATLLVRAGRRSRDALVRGFSLVRRVLPPMMGTQVVLVAIGVVAAVAFEASAILEAGNLSSGGAKLLGIAAIAIGASLWTAGKAVVQLRRTVGLFTPDPLSIMGRPVTREEAPGLWRMLDELATRLGALLPDNVVVGLTGGFFVSSGAKVLEPGGGTLAGRTLYLPLPFLPLLREDEVATIIGHELAHFSGGDTEYSLRFLPIYAGVGRSLDAVALAGMGGDGSISPLTRPALKLGVFVMDQFHHAVRHWSRLREFAADAAGAKVTSADAAARALLRTAAAYPRVDETLERAFRAPDAAPADLVAAALHHAEERGLVDPTGHLEETQPHPTDTHPPTRQRLAALGREPGPELLAEAAAAPPPEAISRLAKYFAEPDSLCRAASADFLRAARDNAREAHQALEAAASEVAEEPVALHENTRGGAIFLFVFGGLLVAGALTVLAVDVPGTDASGKMIAAGAGGGLGLLFIGFGVPLLRRGDKPFAILRQESIHISGLDRPILWEHVADLDITLDGGRLVTRILLPPEAPFPARLPRGRRVKLDPKRRILSFAASPPRHLKVQGFADLIGRYRQADAARRILAAEARAASASDAENVTGA
ncbi:Zn-dependent protease with chaperone function [Roseomonas rosea]|uniref:Zn-dependent protease with chaperone function n=1 Tax=Muricoccus roseus TaxID=198092 RepID=A0A1M6N1D6_9PROT|nr:M48 family metallopeptidase [Roseomonas rosea]SHJ89521.1 Zn-dependent protease with chaperone function [Roseomonas rosea]